MTYPLVSEKAFALALFEQTATDLEQLRIQFEHERFGRYYRRGREWLLNVGNVREERVILAQGAALGIFDRDDVAKRLTQGDATISAMGADELAEYEEKLPKHYPAEQLLKEEFAPTTPSEFLWTLSFRQYEMRRRSDDSRPLQGSILFATNPEWENILGQTAREAAFILDDGSTFPGPLNNTFETVRMCSRLLEYRVGDSLGTADPWGLNSGDWRFQRAEVRFSRLAKDGSAPEEVREAATRLALSNAPGEEQRYQAAQAAATMNDYFLVRLLSVVRQPHALLEDSADDEELPFLWSQIIEALPAADGFAAAATLGPGFSWALSLWRLAPSDPLSQSRIASVIKLVSDVLDSLRPS